MICNLTLVDPSTALRPDLAAGNEMLCFAVNPDQLPHLRKPGDIIRLHRVKACGNYGMLGIAMWSSCAIAFWQARQLLLCCIWRRGCLCTMQQAEAQLAVWGPAVHPAYLTKVTFSLGAHHRIIDC